MVLWVGLLLGGAWALGLGALFLAVWLHDRRVERRGHDAVMEPGQSHMRGR